MHEREQKAADEKKRKAETPTVRTEVEQKKYDEDKAKEEKEGTKKKEDKPARVKIRPLSEAKAIELGANFFSEAFIFAVAAGLLVWDSWRSRRKASDRRDEVEERLSGLESEVNRLRSKYEPGIAALEEKVKVKTTSSAWWNPASWWTRTEPEPAAEQGRIPGNVPGPDPSTVVAVTGSDSVQAKESAKESKAKTEPRASPVAKADDASPVRLDSTAASNQGR